MTEREALKLALDAFGEIAWSNETQWQRDRAKEAITIIKEALAQPEHDYERGFIDGMQKQMQSSVDKAVNRLAQRTWVGLTDEEIDKGLVRTNYAMQTAGAWRDGVDWAIKQLREKNNG